MNDELTRIAELVGWEGEGSLVQRVAEIVAERDMWEREFNQLAEVAYRAHLVLGGGHVQHGVRHELKKLLLRHEPYKSQYNPPRPTTGKKNT